MTVDGAGETVDVVRIGNEDMHKKIEISAWFLRNYLACRNRVLVRQHDNRIHGDRTLAELGIDSFMERKLDDSNYMFDLAVDDSYWTRERLAISRLIGKDLVWPFGKCQDILDFPEGHCEFIVGVDDQGANIKTSYNDDDGPRRFLIPVYFKREVLKKYYDSDKYKVNQDCVSCYSYWSIPIDINKADLVQVYLGDLITKLPIKEQQHWQIYNVLPEGSITERRQARDFDALFVDSNDVVYRFKESLCNFQEGFEKLFGFRLFRPLGEDDADIEDNVRVPLNDDSEEFDKQILYLAKLLPDSIDKGQLLKRVSAERKGLKEPGSIEILEVFLKHESLPDDIINHLRRVQDLRSSGVAHRKGRRYTKNVSKYGLDKTSGKEFIHKMFVDITGALTTLSELLERRHGP